MGGGRVVFPAGADLRESGREPRGPVRVGPEVSGFGANRMGGDWRTVGWNCW